MATNREILFTLKMQNQAREAIQQFASDMKSAGTAADTASAQIKKVSAEANAAGNVFSKAAAEVLKFVNAMRAAEGALAMLGRGAGVGNTFNQINQQLNVTRTTMQSLVATTQRVTSSIVQLSSRSSETNRLTINLREARAAAVSLGDAFAGLTGVFGAYISAQTAVEGVKVYANYEQQLARFKVTAQATKEVMDQVNDAALKLGSSTQFSADQVAGAVTSYVKLGQTVPEALNSVKAAMAVSITSGQELSKVVEETAQMMNEFQIPVTKTSSVMDILTTVSLHSKASIESIGSALSLVGPLANQAGVSFNQMAAMLEVAAKHGLEASKFGTDFQNVLKAITDPTDKVIETLKKLGLSYKDLNTADIPGLFTKLHASGATASDMMNLFGERGARLGSVLAGFAPEVNQATQALKNVGGASEEAAKSMGDTLTGSWNQLVASTKTLVEALGQTGLGKALRDIVDFATSVVREMTNLARWWKDNDEKASAFSRTCEFLITFVGGFVALAGAMRAVALAWAAIDIASGVGAATGIAAILALGGAAVITYRKELEKLLGVKLSLGEASDKEADAQGRVNEGYGDAKPLTIHRGKKSTDTTIEPSHEGESAKNPDDAKYEKIQKSLDKMERGWQNQENEIGKSADEVARMNAELKIKEEFEKEGVALNQKMLDQAMQAYDHLQQAKKLYQENPLNGFTQAVQKFSSDNEKYADATAKVWQTAFDDIADGLSDLVTKGKFDWKKMLDDISSMMVKASIKFLMAKMFDSAFGTGGGGGGAGGIMSLFGGAFGMGGGSGGGSGAPGSSAPATGASGGGGFLSGIGSFAANGGLIGYLMRGGADASGGGAGTPTSTPPAAAPAVGTNGAPATVAPGGSGGSTLAAPVQPAVGSVGGIPGSYGAPLTIQGAGSTGTSGAAFTASPAVLSAIDGAAASHGIDVHDMRTMAAIESRFDPNAYNSGGHNGLFQLSKDIRQDKGLGDGFDPVANSNEGANIWNSNKASLTKFLGREPTSAEIYTAHQQGLGGAEALMGGDPNGSAAQSLSKFYGNQGAQKVLSANNIDPAATNQQALDKIKGTWDDFGKRVDKMGTSADKASDQVGGLGASADNTAKSYDQILDNVKKGYDPNAPTADSAKAQGIDLNTAQEAYARQQTSAQWKGPNDDYTKMVNPYQLGPRDGTAAGNVPSVSPTTPAMPAVGANGMPNWRDYASKDGTFMSDDNWRRYNADKQAWQNGQGQGNTPAVSQGESYLAADGKLYKAGDFDKDDFARFKSQDRDYRDQLLDDNRTQPGGLSGQPIQAMPKDQVPSTDPTFLRQPDGFYHKPDWYQTAPTSDPNVPMAQGSFGSLNRNAFGAGGTPYGSLAGANGGGLSPSQAMPGLQPNLPATGINGNATGAFLPGGAADITKQTQQLQQNVTQMNTSLKGLDTGISSGAQSTSANLTGLSDGLKSGTSGIDGALNGLENKLSSAGGGGGGGAGLGSLFGGGGGLGGGGGADVAVAHTGGTVGSGGLIQRAGMASSAWASARRFHTGGTVKKMFAPGEVPIIAKEGEEVLNPSEAAAYRAGKIGRFGPGSVGGVSDNQGVNHTTHLSVTNHITTPDAQSFRKSESQLGYESARTLQRQMGRTGNQFQQGLMPK